MKKIEVKILNPDVVKESEKMMVCAARLTQRGEKIKDMNGFMELYNRSYRDETVKAMTSLPHPTIQKFGVINAVVVGASRRFLAQITRHQNEVKFMSASLQYSDYSGEADFTIPYAILLHGKSAVDRYLLAQREAMAEYQFFAENGVDNDSCGYMAPQGLRNVLIISATPYQWKHMIKQRTCNRNTKETQYVMLKLWEALYELSPTMFADCGPFCTSGPCLEGRMCCKRPFEKGALPTDIRKREFPLLYRGVNHEN